MYPDLMRPARVQLNFNQRAGVDAKDGAPVRASFSRIAELFAVPGFALRGHTNTLHGITPDWQVDATMLASKHTVDQRDVGFPYGAGAKGFAEFGVGEIILGDEDHAGRFLSETMHDAGPKCVSALRKRLTTAQQGVDERAPRDPSTGMNNHARRLINGQQVVILKKNGKRNGFGFRKNWRALRHLHFNSLA